MWKTLDLWVTAKLKQNIFGLFLVEVVWKDQGDPRLHQRIHDILQMKIASLMDFITLGPPEEVAKEEVLPQPTDGQE